MLPADGSAREVSEIIGWDPERRQIRSWVFTSDGRFAEGFWNRAGDSWEVRYEGRGAGGKTLESATFFIREDDEIVGMLCVNTDLSTVRSINAMAQQLMACFDAAPTRTEPAPIEVESLSESTQELIDRSIAELLSARGLDVASLGQSDRVDVIRHLNGNGVFMLKGAVACAATALGISEPSVYRYLQKVRKEG